MQRIVYDCRMVKISEKRLISGHSSRYGSVLPVGKPRCAGFPWSEPRKAASPTHPFLRRCEVMSASLALSRHSRTPATLPYGRKNIGKLKGPERRRENKSASPHPRMSKNRRLPGQKRARLCPCCHTELIQQSWHEYSLTLGRTSYLPNRTSGIIS